MLTKEKFSDTTLSTGAAGMPMVDAIVTKLAFSEELSFSVCKERYHGDVRDKSQLSMKQETSTTLICICRSIYFKRNTQ